MLEELPDFLGSVQVGKMPGMLAAPDLVESDFGSARAAQIPVKHHLTRRLAAVLERQLDGLFILATAG